MYESFFGLARHPFSMTADPDFLLLTAQHREALAGLTYSILTRRGIAVLTGDVGTGKTTLLAKALRFFPESGVRTSVIPNPTLTNGEFLEAVLSGFGLGPIPDSKVQRLRMLEDFLRAQKPQKKIPALIIDEAHSLSPALLEEVRLLGNLEDGDEKLLPILLLGQNELDEKLERADLRQFKQRVALRFSMGPLMPGEVEQYIRHRWATAGGVVPGPFSEGAVRAVEFWSNGYPRKINVICDNALLAAFSEQSKVVTVLHVQSAAADLKLSRPAVVEAAAVAPPVASPAPANGATLQLASPAPLRTLETYVETGSFWARWAGRLGITQVRETV